MMKKHFLLTLVVCLFALITCDNDNNHLDTMKIMHHMAKAYELLKQQNSINMSSFREMLSKADMATLPNLSTDCLKSITTVSQTNIAKCNY